MKKRVIGVTGVALAAVLLIFGVSACGSGASSGPQPPFEEGINVWDDPTRNVVCYDKRGEDDNLSCVFIGP